jgi:hypothetical protein
LAIPDKLCFKVKALQHLVYLLRAQQCGLDPLQLVFTLFCGATESPQKY